MDVEVETTEGGASRKRRVHGMLKMYYGLNEEGKADQPGDPDPCDINGPHFDPDVYLNKVNKSFPQIRVNLNKVPEPSAGQG